MTAQTPQTPSEIYLEIANKAQDPENYHFSTQTADLNRLLHVTADLIRVNALQKSQLRSAEDLINEQSIENLSKDIEIYNLRGDSPESPAFV